MKKLLLISVAISILLCACNTNKTKKEASEIQWEGDLQSIRLGAMSSMDYVPFVIADKKGIYESLGLDVNIVKFFSANDRDAAFQSGNIDGTIIDLTGAIIQQANGIPLRIVMKNDGFFYLIAGKESNIHNTSHLAGKNIAVSRNTAIEFSTDKVLENAGISPEQINKPEINKIPLRLEMLQNGQIDASIFPDPFATMAKSNGHTPLITTKNLGISITGTIFTQKALEQKKREIQLLIKGYNLAVDYMKKHPIDEWTTILTEDTGLPEHLLNEITLPTYKHAELPSRKDISITIQWLKNKKLIPTNYMENTLIDSTFVSTK